MRGSRQETETDSYRRNKTKNKHTQIKRRDVTVNGRDGGTRMPVAAFLDVSALYGHCWRSSGCWQWTRKRNTAADAAKATTC